MKKSISQFNKGMSTLEILLAFAILILAITAVIGMGFGNQSITVDAETYTEALSKAQSNLEEARAKSREDFFSLSTNSSSDLSGPLTYTKNLLIEDLSSCSKKATSSVTWSASPLREQKIELVSIFNDVSTALGLGGDCVDAPNSGDEWDNPDSDTFADLSPSGAKATGIDAAKIDGKSYIFVTSISGTESDDDFWIFDAKNPKKPEKVASINIGGCQNDKDTGNGCGLNAIDVAGNYAYLANASSTKTASSDELVIVDISTPTDPEIISRISLGITPKCTGGSAFCPGGAKTVRYFKNRLYVGTHRINGNELSIFNVEDPSDPKPITSKDFNHNIYDIAVNENYIYLATSDFNGEVYELDNYGAIPSLNVIDVYNAPNNKTNDQYGKALYLKGNQLYLGRDGNASEDDFYILDLSTPSDIKYINSINITQKSNAGITGIIISGKFAFLSTSNSTAGFQVWNVANPLDISATSKCNIYNYSEKATGIDFQDDYVYISNESQYALRIIYDSSSLCTKK